MGGSAFGETELQRWREREIDGRERFRRDRATERERKREIEMGGSTLGETDLQRGRERERDGREHIRRDRATERERKRDRWEGAH